VGLAVVSGAVFGAHCAIYMPAKAGTGGIVFWAQMSQGTRTAGDFTSSCVSPSFPPHMTESDLVNLQLQSAQAPRD
jgi:hypothetical protein